MVLKVAGGSFELQVSEEEGSSICSTFAIGPEDADFGAEYRDYWNTSIDALESLILAHACEGVDVQAPAYVQGIEAALESLENQL
jgi:hypothetical protein